ncbi:MAG TPA: CAP domain-containing protein [Solirubrobacteraceae bacterium]
MAAFATLALCAPAAAQADDCAGADLVPAADNVAVVSGATLCLLNQQRATNGIGPLVENAALSTASAGYSQRMVAQGFFGHESPDGGTLVERLTAVGYLGGDDAWVVGENIGWGQASLATARSMVAAWMNSPGHRENLLSADYTQVGLGLALGTPTDQTWGATYTTDFGAGAAPAAADARAKAAAAPRTKASRAASCAHAASTRRGARTTKAKRSSACGRSARLRRR